jgi:hypothetical protein
MAPVPAPVFTGQPPVPTASAKPTGGVQVPSWVIIPISIIFGLVLLWIVLGLLARRRVANSRATTTRAIPEHRMHNWHDKHSPGAAVQRDDERLKNLMLETHKEFARQYGGWNPDKLFYQTGKSGEAAIYVNVSRKAQGDHTGLVDIRGRRSDRTQRSVDRSVKELPPIPSSQYPPEHSPDGWINELPQLPNDPRVRSADAVDTPRGRSRSSSVPRAHPPTRRGTPHPRHRRSRTVGTGSYSETSKLTKPLTYRPPRFSIESAPDSEIMELSDKDKHESSDEAPMSRFSPLLLALNLEDSHPIQQDRPPRVVTPERRVPEVEGATDPHTRIVSHYGIIGDAGDEHPSDGPEDANSFRHAGQKDRAVQSRLRESAPQEAQQEISQTVTPADSDESARGGAFSVSQNGSYGKMTVQKLDLVRVRTDDEELDWPLPKSPPVGGEKVTKEAPRITIDLDSEPLGDAFTLPRRASDFRHGFFDSYVVPIVPARGSSRRA